MPELNTRHKQTKDAFDQRFTELKRSRQKDLDKSKVPLGGIRPGETNHQELSFLIHFQKRART